MSEKKVAEKERGRKRTTKKRKSTERGADKEGWGGGAIRVAGKVGEEQDNGDERGKKKRQMTRNEGARSPACRERLSPGWASEFCEPSTRKVGKKAEERARTAQMG